MCFLGTSHVTVRRNVLSRVLSIPERIVVEADECVSFMSAAYSAAGLIQQPLTFYRLHSGNLFQLRTKDEAKQRRILQSLTALAQEFRIRLASAGITPDVTGAIVKPLDVDSRRLRLTLDGGMPWETFQTERDQFKIVTKRRRWLPATQGLRVCLYARDDFQEFL